MPDVLTQRLQRLKTLDTMTHSVQGVTHWCVCARVHACTCVCSAPIVQPILFHELPGGLPRGQPAPGPAAAAAPVYLKLFLVYLMNGCLGEALGGGAQSVSTGTLM